MSGQEVQTDGVAVFPPPLLAIRCLGIVLTAPSSPLFIVLTGNQWRRKNDYLSNVHLLSFFYSSMLIAETFNPYSDQVKTPCSHWCHWQSVCKMFCKLNYMASIQDVSRMCRK